MRGPTKYLTKTKKRQCHQKQGKLEKLSNNQKEPKETRPLIVSWYPDCDLEIKLRTIQKNQGNTHQSWTWFRLVHYHMCTSH